MAATQILPETANALNNKTPTDFNNKAFTDITSDLLHDLGWKSFVDIDDDEPYFVFKGHILLYDPLHNLWGDGFNKTYKSWEDFMACYKKDTGHNFKPGTPTKSEDQFEINIA